MKQPVTLSRTLLDASSPEASLRKNSGKELLSDLHPEDLTNLPIGHSKEGANFDFSNFGMFFNKKAQSMKTANELAPSFHSLRKRSSETSSQRESTKNRLPSKDNSNLDDLYEDTTVIGNPADPFKPHPKKVSTEISNFKPSHEETKEVSLEGPFSHLNEKSGLKKEAFPNVFSGLYKILKEEKPAQDLLAPISNLGAGCDEEQEKIEASFFKDSKFSTNNINIEVMERIKSKSLHHHNRNHSMANSTNISNTSSSGSSNVAHSEARHNNNSVFNNVRKINKASTPFNNLIKKETEDSYHLDPTKDTINSMLNNFDFEPQSDVLKIEDLVQASPQGKDNSLQNQSIFTKSLDSNDLAKSYDNNENKKSRLATDSTVDSENFAMTFNAHRPPHHHHSNSFSTFFNGDSNSYNNSRKLDFSSPLKVESARLNEGHSNPISTPINDFQQRSAGPAQGNIFQFDPKLLSLYGGFGSRNNTDSSNSLSWNDEYVNSNFSSSLSTPQERHHNKYLNQSLSINPSTNIDQQYMSSAQISPHNLKGRVNRSYTAHASNKSVQGIPSSNAAQFNKDLNPLNLNKEGKDAAKPKKRNNEAKDTSSFEIDLTKLEANGKTTLMIRNIPNKYDLPLMLQTIERNHKGKFDFFYLPIDPRNKCNVGYAFINFNEPKFIKDFVIEFNNKKWEKFNSEKICDIKYGRIQGKKALMHHFQYSNVMNQQDKKLKPYFCTDYEGMSNQRIKDLVNKQKLESVEDMYEAYQE